MDVAVEQVQVYSCLRYTLTKFPWQHRLKPQSNLFIHRKDTRVLHVLVKQQHTQCQSHKWGLGMVGCMPIFNFLMDIRSYPVLL